MKIAYLHFHLKAGGVTSVIKHQVQAVEPDNETLVISSSDKCTFCNGSAVCVPELGYDSDQEAPANALMLADKIQKAITDKWPSGCDVLHVHNPTLNKNSFLIDALNILQERGIRFFLQIHDFAEDGRPNAYYKDPYPENAHYGVINSRDYAVLLKAGLKEQGVHYVPNQVVPFPEWEVSNSGYILYPVRGIRRKNTGEAILLSLFSPKDHPVAVTLPPNSSWEKKIHSMWRNLIRDKRLNVHLDIGLNEDFETLVRTAYFIITTSVNEGFGFAFLEPWTALKNVFGRRIEHVCKDFEETGMIFNDFYSRILIPIDFFDMEKFCLRREELIVKFGRLFGVEPDKHRINRSSYQLSEKGLIDFGMLDEQSQKQVILNLADNEKKRNRIKAINPHLEKMRISKEDAEVINENRQVVVREYSRDKYRQRLLDVYNKVINVDVSHSINKKVVLESFFNPVTFCILRWPDV